MLIMVYDDIDTMIAMGDEKAAKVDQRLRRTGSKRLPPEELRSRTSAGVTR